MSKTKSIYNQYIDFLNFIDPFETAEREGIYKSMRHTTILYDLTEMRKDWGWDANSEEYKRATDLIELIEKRVSYDRESN